MISRKWTGNASRTAPYKLIILLRWILNLLKYVFSTNKHFTQKIYRITANDANRTLNKLFFKSKGLTGTYIVNKSPLFDLIFSIKSVIPKPLTSIYWVGLHLTPGFTDTTLIHSVIRIFYYRIFLPFHFTTMRKIWQ